MNVVWCEFAPSFLFYAELVGASVVVAASVLGLSVGDDSSVLSSVLGASVGLSLLPASEEGDAVLLLLFELVADVEPSEEEEERQSFWHFTTAGCRFLWHRF